jgi:hypothetical protein
MKGILEEAVVACYKVLIRQLSAGGTENRESFRAVEIRTGQLPNTSQGARVPCSQDQVFTHGARSAELSVTLAEGFVLPQRPAALSPRSV